MADEMEIQNAIKPVLTIPNIRPVAAMIVIEKSYNLRFKYSELNYIKNTISEEVPTTTGTNSMSHTKFIKLSTKLIKKAKEAQIIK